MRVLVREYGREYAPLDSRHELLDSSHSTKDSTPASKDPKSRRKLTCKKTVAQIKSERANKTTEAPPKKAGLLRGEYGARAGARARHCSSTAARRRGVEARGRGAARIRAGRGERNVRFVG